MNPAGWYPDAHNPAMLRYWDGRAWTQHVHPGYNAPPPPPYGAPAVYGAPAAYGTPAVYGPPMYPTATPVVAAKNPAVSLIVSFFLPGVGSMINGDTGTGIAILLLWLISIPLMFVLIGFVTIIIAFVWGLVDAYQGARRWNARHGIIS